MISFLLRTLAIFLACTLAAGAADWPEFLGPNRDGTSPETGLVDRIPAGGLRVVWQKDIGTGYGAPSVRDGVLVLHHRVGSEEIVEAMNAATGEPLWRHKYPSFYQDPFGYNNGPRCSPLLTADRCYTLGAEGVLKCLDIKSGKQVWLRATQIDFQVPEAFFGVGSSPVLEDGKLIVQVGGQPDSNIVAFDAATGKTLWQNGGAKTWDGALMHGWPGEPFVKWDPGHPAFQKMSSYCTPVLATIHGRRHVLTVTRQGLISLDPATGAHNFSFWFRSPQESTVNAMTPVVSGDLILISSAYYRSGSVLLRVRPDGKGVDEVWRSLALEMHWSQPSLVGGFLYGFSGRNEPDASFRCVEFTTGKVKWERNEGWPNASHSKLRAGEAPPNVFGRGSTIFADGKLFALGEAGLLGLFKPNAEKIEEVSRWQVPGLTYPCWAGPVLSGKRLYLRCENKLICLDVAKPD
ncbi:MAG: PQQ-binding-like beta-propeller repeat protein [Chthoniobacteraceae bacterium]